MNNFFTKFNIIALCFILNLSYIKILYGKSCYNMTLAYDHTPVSSHIIENIEHYFHNITTLYAKFVQHSSNSHIGKGKFYLEHPKKLRVEYKLPEQILIFSAGQNIIFYDQNINTPTYSNIENTPFFILLEKTLSLKEKLKIIHYRKKNKILYIQLISKSNPCSGSIELILQNDPIKLRQWIITDYFSIRTKITFFDLKEDRYLNPELFQFKRIWYH